MSLKSIKKNEVASDNSKKIREWLKLEAGQKEWCAQ